MKKKSLKIIGFCCMNAFGGEKNFSGSSRVAFDPNVKIVTLPCSSKVEILGILKAFESGADGVFVLGCPEGECRLLNGNHRAQNIVNYVKAMLDEIGIESCRLEMFQLGTSEFQSLDQVTQAMISRIESL
ncbi:MAG: hydrogenase iron-sulfur subunit [Deltaproteobacteria bacterium]|nr:hydrogenase iron-sulfur subunit [Deltaproteobacteria bacterium]MBW2660583.1 hydrogenase iron-sulfur subunit [Deltaproteobacteria bacterium]